MLDESQLRRPFLMERGSQKVASRSLSRATRAQRKSTSYRASLACQPDEGDPDQNDGSGDQHPVLERDAPDREGLYQPITHLGEFIGLS